MGKNKKTQKKTDEVKFLGTYCTQCGSTNIGTIYKPQYITEIDFCFCYDCGAILRPAQQTSNSATEDTKEV